MGGGGSKAQPAQVPNKEKPATTTTLGPPEATCENYIFNTTGCNITIQGKLLLVLDSINSTLRNYFSCFCEVVQARLNNTNVTTETLAGRNQSSCYSPEPHSNVDEVLLQDKLKDLNSEYQDQDKYAGMAVILTDRGFTSENFSTLSDDQEPFLYFVNVGKNESQNGSCHRQYRYIDEMTKINDISLELESIACDPSSVYMNNNCIPDIPRSSTPSLAVITVVSSPLIISSVVVALVLVGSVLLVFALKCRRREVCSKNTALENSDNKFGHLTAAGKDSSSTNDINNGLRENEKQVNDIYNELREDEKRVNNDENQENYHHLDLNFVKEELDPAVYDHVTETVYHNKVF